MFLLQSRLHLTADQAAAIKAAMDADGKARRDVMRQMFQNNGKVDPQAAAKANTLDQTLATVLTPQQKAAYQQVQAEEKTSRADTSATIQVNQVAPLLQLSDAQKDQAFSALYQVQMAAPDPSSLMTNPNVGTAIVTQAQATQDALAKVLTVDQMALYQQQAQYDVPVSVGVRGAVVVPAAVVVVAVVVCSTTAAAHRLQLLHPLRLLLERRLTQRLLLLLPRRPLLRLLLQLPRTQLRALKFTPHLSSNCRLESLVSKLHLEERELQIRSGER